MNFALSNKRASLGNDLTAAVTAEGDERITKVKTDLDGHTLATDTLSPVEISYNRVFAKVGLAGPGRDHVMVVTATSSRGKTVSGSHRWTDKR